MSDTRDALMRAILVDPADDTARLVYADWLEENGGSVPCPTCNGTGHELWSCKVCGAEPRDDGEVEHGRGCYRLSCNGGGSEYPDLNPCAACECTGTSPNGNAERAEFVRVQCELENLRKGDGSGGITIPRTGEQCKRWKWLSEREREIMGTNLFLSWCGRTVAKNVNESRYRRGFIWYIGCTLANWMQHGPRIVAEQPVERVEVSDKRPMGRDDIWHWGGAVGQSESMPNYLPLLSPLWKILNDGGPNKGYPTEAAAQSALSLALVNWARREAGLPPLEGRR